MFSAEETLENFDRMTWTEPRGRTTERKTTNMSSGTRVRSVSRLSGTAEKRSGTVDKIKSKSSTAVKYAGQSETNFDIDTCLNNSL